MASQQSPARAVRQKWDLDEIIAPDKRHEASEFVCSVCMGVWNDPVQSVSCHHIFCKSCVLDVPNPVTICPVCRESVPPNGFDALQTANRFVLRMLNNLPVLCPFHKPEPTAEPASAPAAAADGSVALPGRVVEGQDSEPPLTRRRVESGSGNGASSTSQCSWKGSYADLSKHLATCEWCIVTCPHGCGEEMQRCRLEEHLPACQLNWHSCEICNEKVRPSQVQDHNKDTAERHVEILRKQKEEQKELTKLEQKLKEHFMAELASVTREVKSLRAAIASANVTEAVWTVKDMAAVRQQHPRGSPYFSPPFQLGPLANVRLMLYPNGKDTTRQGGFAIFVQVTSEETWLLDFTVKVNEESKTFGVKHRFIPPQYSYGWTDFGKSLPEAGDVEITTRLGSFSRVVS